MPDKAATPLVISLGDPAGIGPEIIARIWLERERLELPPFVVAGGISVLENAATNLGLNLSLRLIDDPAQCADTFAFALPVLGDLDGDYHPGEPDTDGAKLAYSSLCAAIELACNGLASGVVTAPVAKSQIAKIAPDFIGQTELCADLCNASREDAVMLLAGPQLRAIPLTVHCALADVPKLITRDLILHRGRITAKAMTRDFGIANPRLAFTGLNPHSGENGHMGREEIDTITPAIEQLCAEGINATGPYPADTLFAPHIRGRYDVALAMYHDQALAPMKALDFDNGVNMTIGLPIVRTSPDHGTAFNIAGKGEASVTSTVAAIKLAGEVAARRATFANG